MKTRSFLLSLALVGSAAILPTAAGACEISWRGSGFEAENCTAEYLRQQLDARRTKEVYRGEMPPLEAQVIQLPDLVAIDIDVYKFGDTIDVRGTVRNESNVNVTEPFLVVVNMAISDPDVYYGFPPTGRVIRTVERLDAGDETVIQFWERLPLPPTTYHWDIQVYMGVDLTNGNMMLPWDGGLIREGDEKNNIRFMGCRLFGEGPVNGPFVLPAC